MSFARESPLVISRAGAMSAGRSSGDCGMILFNRCNVCLRGRLQTIKKIIYPPSLVTALQAEVTEASRAGRKAGEHFSADAALRGDAELSFGLAEGCLEADVGSIVLHVVFCSQEKEKRR